MFNYSLERKYNKATHNNSLTYVGSFDYYCHPGALYSSTTPCIPILRSISSVQKRREDYNRTGKVRRMAKKQSESDLEVLHLDV
jgi:hypothetical protein